MAAYANLVQETTTTTGTGTYSLGGATSGNRTFVKGVGDGIETVYLVTDGSGVYEVVRGTVTAGSPATLSRTAIIESVSTPGGDVGTSPIDWGSGTKTVTQGLPANRAIAQSPDGTSTVNLRAPLSAIDALTPAADRMIYYTGTSAAALLACTSYGRSLLNAADASALRTLAGTVIGTDIQAYDADLAAIAALSSAADKVPYATGSGTWALADFPASGRALAAVSSIALGDLIYGSGADTVAKLTGNTTTTKKFLRMTGNGSAAAAPAWDTLVNGDIPTALTGKTYEGLTITSSTGTLTIPNGATLTMSGAYSCTLTFSGATGVTFPTTGTLATLAGSETLTNKTITSPTLDGSLTRITSTNTILGDTISAQTISGQVPRVQVSGTNTATASIGVIRWSNTANGPAVYLAKSRSDTPGTQAVAQDADTVGTLVWAHSDGSVMARAASIECKIQGTPGAGDLPTSVGIYTNPDGSVSSALALICNSNQTTSFSGNILPSADNTHNVGNGSFRWKEIFAATGTINTSDERQKRDIADLDGAAMLSFLLALRPISHRWVDQDEPAAVETMIEQRPMTERRQVARTVIEIVEGRAVRRIEVVEIDEPIYDDYPLVDADGSPILDVDGQQIIHRVQRVEEVQVERTVRAAVSVQHSRTHFGLLAQQVRDAMTACGLSDQDFAGWIDDAESGMQGLRYHQFIPALIAAVQVLAARVVELEAAQSSG